MKNETKNIRRILVDFSDPGLMTQVEKVNSSIVCGFDIFSVKVAGACRLEFTLGHVGLKDHHMIGKPNGKVNGRTKGPAAGTKIVDCRILPVTVLGGTRDVSVGEFDPNRRGNQDPVYQSQSCWRASLICAVPTNVSNHRGNLGRRQRRRVRVKDDPLDVL